MHNTGVTRSEMSQRSHSLTVGDVPHDSESSKKLKKKIQIARPPCGKSDSVDLEYDVRFLSSPWESWALDFCLLRKN